VLENYKTAPIDEKLRAMLGFLEKLSLAPESVGPADVAALRAQAITRAAARDALYVCFLFNVYDRLADAMGWELMDDGGYQATANHLLKRGYL
jgi:alkylhydroperoxidase family enzyme